MNSIGKALSSLIILMVFIVPSVSFAAGPTIDHRFFMEFPDGSKEEIKGVKIHHSYKGRTDLGEPPLVTSNFCRYDGQGENLQRPISSGYHCATNESCFYEDFGAPYLPASFDNSGNVYGESDASYKNFNDVKFTEMVKRKAPYLVQLFNAGSIRGFDGARWQGTVDYTASDSNGVVEILSNPPSRPHDNPDWGNIPGINGTQSWSGGEVYRNPLGGNILQAKISWTLKVPEPEIARCATLDIPANASIGQTININVTAVSSKGVDDVSLYYAPVQQSYCSADVWTQIGVAQKTDFIGNASFSWNTSSITPGDYVVTANIKDDSGFACTGNPSGTCGTTFAECQNCSGSITFSQPTPTPSPTQPPEAPQCIGVCASPAGGEPCNPAEDGSVVGQPQLGDVYQFYCQVTGTNTNKVITLRKPDGSTSTIRHGQSVSIDQHGNYSATCAIQPGGITQ